MTEFNFTPRGVCSRQIKIKLDGNIIKRVDFVGGCAGNTQGVARLVEGMSVEDAVSRLEGIECGMKETSCPDQLAKALIEAFKESKGK